MEFLKFIKQNDNGKCYIYKKLNKRTTMSGNEDLNRDLIDAHKMLGAYAVHLTKNIELADDLLQETLLKILTNSDKYEEQGKFQAWARQVMKNTFLNESTRNEKRLERFIDGYDYENDVTVHPLVAENDYRFSRDEIDKAISMLPPKYAQIMTLQMIGYKYEEIAEKMNISLGNVKSSIFTAKSILRKILNS